MSNRQILGLVGAISGAVVLYYDAKQEWKWMKWLFGQR